ncbi:MAG: prepilin-type N-terminal cleavage/methylation domain-containing protein [Planctomycetes bacterium]|nr:prepilin-type N-terminal cleavage/methylation domain-containing protein [Planctomycetota bacterium]
MNQRSHHARRRGYTILELLASLTIFAVIWYSLAIAIRTGVRAERAVAEQGEANREMRRSVGSLTDELRWSNESTVTVATLADGNHSLTFMQPIQVGGNQDWGVYDKSLGDDEDEQNRPDWQIRYTVVSANVGNDTERRLVRQILDDDGDVQKQTVLATRLNDGVGAAPGFQATKSGDVWVLTLSTAAIEGTSEASSEVFHVRTRNDD